jgi:Amt family ammonium transporter
VATLEAIVANLKTNLSDVDAREAAAEAATMVEVNTFYLLWAGALVFLMQAGFAVLSAGSIRTKNVKNILLKNLLDACMGAVGWYTLGYGFAYQNDDNANPFIGGGPSTFALSGEDDTKGEFAHGYGYITWWFQYAFAAAAATIVSGAVAERCELVAYLVYTFLITSFIYPVVVHWVWDTNGFLCAWGPNAIGRFTDGEGTEQVVGMIDFAGSGVVHMTGGFAALMGAKILGRRIGRFEEPEHLYQGHSSTLQVLGTFLLWFGWYGFNPGSTLAAHGTALGADFNDPTAGTAAAARSAVTTTLSAAVAGISGLFIKRFLPPFLGGSPGTYDLGHTCNSLLGGLVAITAGCSVVAPYGAIVIGFIAAWVYHGASCLMRKLWIDDPLDAFAVHGACGAFGCIMIGFFATKEYAYAPDCGVFYGGNGTLLGVQIAGVVIEILWVTTLSGIMFMVLKLAGILRVSEEDERVGADVSKHGGEAYPEMVAKAKAADAPKSATVQLGLTDQKPKTEGV